MRVIFMGRKPAASVALRSLVDRGVAVAAVVAPIPPTEPTHATFWRPLLRDTAKELRIPVITDEELYRAIDERELGRPTAIDLEDVDLVVSFLFWKRIREPLISFPRLGCFNFHPGPLPTFRGRRGYNHAILEGHSEYGASVHWVSERFDEGDLVRVSTFPIRVEETALSLEQRTMECLLGLFEDFIARVHEGEVIPRHPQGEGRSASKNELLALMRVHMDDNPDVVARKVRAFWYPPHTGATISIGGRDYTLVDRETLSKLGRFLHGSRDRPT